MIFKNQEFTKGKRQLGDIEVEQARWIANVRIHAERVNGNIRNKYSILYATQPIDFVTVGNGQAAVHLSICVIQLYLLNEP